MLCVCENIRPEFVPIRGSQFVVCTHLAITWYQQLMIKKITRQEVATPEGWRYTLGMAVAVEIHNTGDPALQRDVVAIIEHVLSDRPRDWRAALQPASTACAYRGMISVNVHSIRSTSSRITRIAC